MTTPQLRPPNKDQVRATFIHMAKFTKCCDHHGEINETEQATITRIAYAYNANTSDMAWNGSHPLYYVAGEVWPKPQCGRISHTLWHSLQHNWTLAAEYAEESAHALDYCTSPAVFLCYVFHTWFYYVHTTIMLPSHYHQVYHHATWIWYP